MRLPLALLATVAALGAAGSAQAASVEIKDAVARVTVIPENRNDIKVEIVAPNPRTPLEIRTFGGRTIVDGNLGRRIHDCRGAGENVRVDVRGVGDIGWREMAQVVIHAPRDVQVSAGGAVFGSVGRSQSLVLNNAGCGDWTVANVQGDLRLHQAGSGDTRTGSAGNVRVKLAGSGDIMTSEIRGGLDVDIAGSGDVIARSINGPLSVSIAGSGDVSVGGGRATSMNVTVMGSGDVAFRGVADSLKARIAGSGDVRAKEVKGEISKSIAGSGSVTIGQP